MLLLVENMVKKRFVNNTTVDSIDAHYRRLGAFDVAVVDKKTGRLAKKTKMRIK